MDTPTEKAITALFILLLSSLLSSCNNGGSQVPSQSSPSNEAVVSPIILGQKVFDTKCASCHGSDGSAGVLGQQIFKQFRWILP